MPKTPQYTIASGHILQNANEHAFLANRNHNAAERC